MHSYEILDIAKEEIHFYSSQIWSIILGEIFHALWHVVWHNTSNNEEDQERANKHIKSRDIFSARLP